MLGLTIRQATSRNRVLIQTLQASQYPESSCYDALLDLKKSNLEKNFELYKHDAADG